VVAFIVFIAFAAVVVGIIEEGVRKALLLDASYKVPERTAVGSRLVIRPCVRHAVVIAFVVIGIALLHWLRMSTLGMKSEAVLVVVVELRAGTGLGVWASLPALYMDSFPHSQFATSATICVNSELACYLIPKFDALAGTWPP
jgi:hypothetical protein